MFPVLEIKLLASQEQHCQLKNAQPLSVGSESLLLPVVSKEEISTPT